MNSNRLLLDGCAGGVAFLAALLTGYVCWRALERRGSAIGVQRWGGERLRALFGFLPLWIGCVCGLAVIAVLRRNLTGDRFYEPAVALKVGLAPLLAGLVFLLVDMIKPKPVVQPGGRAGAGRTAGRTALMLAAQLVASGVVVLAGIVFPILSVAPGNTVELGTLAPIATIAWLLFATSFVKLLDGLHGAALFLLLLAALAVGLVTSFNNEFFLNAYAAVVTGAVIGSLRFHLHPPRIVQSGGATAFVGFMFAVLTVLARQKTVAALLIVLPLVVVVLVAGGLMLGFLERNLLLKKDEK